MFEIRMITPEDTESYWDLRLNALKNNPEAFSANYEDQISRSLDSVRARILTINDHFIMGAFNNEIVIGMIGFVREPDKKLSHKGNIWGTYVLPEFRGQGIGHKLLDKVLLRAKKIEGISQINLGVITFNEAAKKMYESHGFISYGLEKNSMIHNEKYFDEELMAYHF
ncbi:GNAT family N-acetyltransferase [Paenibacillus nasutitermitis]|uniref:N-acetyltransferase n=1 Tax=Paenibacillus nasutitermitis TaxID=1652958 RepID=A0A916ZHE5_9BACL|nr:GNAT family N-acetyltransferase [Paenibacillus nasutitermitis]GGD98061.1 N-acetyltransferase [Paenibacillus nasutitermitis]